MPRHDDVVRSNSRELPGRFEYNAFSKDLELAPQRKLAEVIEICLRHVEVEGADRLGIGGLPRVELGHSHGCLLFRFLTARWRRRRPGADVFQFPSTCPTLPGGEDGRLARMD